MSFIQDIITEAREDDIFTLVDELKHCYNGAESRGASIPEPIPGCINQANIPDNMRLKSFDVEVVDGNTIQIEYITQEPFTSDDADILIKEINDAVENISEDYGIPVNGTIEIICRDGKEEGYALADIDNSSLDGMLSEVDESVMPNRSEWGTNTVKEIGDYVIRKSVEFDGTTYTVFKDWDTDTEIGKYIDTFMTEEEAESCIKNLSESLDESVEASFVVKPFNLKWHYGGKDWDDNSFIVAIPNIITMTNANGEKNSIDAVINCYDENDKLIQFNTAEDAQDYISKYLDTREARLEQNNDGTFSAYISNEELTEAILTERKSIFKSNGAYMGKVRVIDLHNDMQEVTLSQIGITDEDKFLNTIQKCKTSDDILKVLRKFSNPKIGWSVKSENDKSCSCEGYSTDKNNEFVALRAIFLKKRKTDSDDNNTLNLIDIGKYKKAVADVYKSMVSELGEEQALELIKNFAITADQHYSKLDLGESLNGKLKEEKLKMITESRENRRYSVEDNLQKAVNHYKEWSKCNDGEVITEDYINKDMWRLKRVSNLHNIPVDRIKSELLKDSTCEN